MRRLNRLLIPSHVWLACQGCGGCRLKASEIVREVGVLMAANSSPDFARTARAVVGFDCRAAAVESVGLLEQPSLGFEVAAMAVRYF